ncbi:glycoside hydrolase family 127 protein [Lachnotalea sp. AF33-28]|uniref:glycoside hydrolase family 127 protein n=1 Tax=Lachnotalea sp. AF33-28 TaxID=2292046 RepID=UPI000E4C9D1A|nr:beta-L-arabinofuranosidase domain-containing protein [Lachnotalea sp. AF33-28]RHP31033.1 glycoside hydrolase family 127 protein [Lachnotalea sp. AF33-28]
MNNVRPIDLTGARVSDKFWGEYMELVRSQVIPYQWEALNDRIEGATPSHCIHNFRVAAGLEEGGFQGFVFQDSDLYKWLEAVAWSLAWHPDAKLEVLADETIDLIGAAQQPDGYLDTKYIIDGLENRFTDLMNNHELYCLGHMIEAAVAYYKATGKRRFMDIAIGYVDCVDSLFGPEEGKLKGYPGHEVAEMALVGLYKVTGEERFLKLAKYFVDQRGQSPLYFEEELKKRGRQNGWNGGTLGFQYYQAALPVREQTEAQGHSVRAVYLYSGIADVAAQTEDAQLFETCERLWNNLVNRRMYITGAIGSSAYGEAFTFDYDLPNDTVYGETCAAIGLCFFARRMFENTKDAKYMDVLERALYNGVISGMSLDGRKFFYVNPLEVLPEACEKDQNKRHVKYERQKWFGCACCPPNVARILSSLGAYAYQESDDTVFMSLFVGGTFSACLGGMHNRFSVTTDYPWDGTVKVKAESLERAEFSYAIRIPAWCADYQVKINGEAVEGTVDRGYLYLNRTWSEGDEIELTLNMPVELIAANPRIREDIGKAVVMRGPLVYCLEEADNGGQLQTVRLDPRAGFEVIRKPELLGGVNVIKTAGKAIDINAWDPDTPYRRYEAPVYKERELTFIPYYSWTNRTPGEMTVWVHTL